MKLYGCGMSGLLSQLSYKPVMYHIIIHILPQNTRDFFRLISVTRSVLLMVDINISYFTYV